MEPTLSSPTPAGLRAWRIFFESALALMDLLGTELEQAVGIPMRWYDVLVQLEESPEGLPCSQSGSSTARAVSRGSSTGWKRRGSSAASGRRTTGARFVVLTEKGRETMEEARRHHRDGIERHFAAHLADEDVKCLTSALEKVSTHARPLRPGRIRG